MTFGEFRHDEVQYAHEIERWSKCGNMELAVSQDYMTEDSALARTGKTIIEHQKLTVGRFLRLRSLIDFPIMPILQGQTAEDYVRQLGMYGIEIEEGARVGVGSVCRRNRNVKVIRDILAAIMNERPDLKLHGFGLKTTALEDAYTSSLLYSADSMAWSYAARREGRNRNGVEEALAFSQKINDRSGRKASQLQLPIVST